MKDISKFLNEGMINEASKTEYRVSFIDFKDKNGNPIPVNISVDYDITDEFEKFLKDQQDTVFFSAEGGDINYPGNE